MIIRMIFCFVLICCTSAINTRGSTSGTRRRFAVLLLVFSRAAGLAVLALVAVVLAKGQHDGTAQLSRRVGQQPLQPLLDGEPHQVFAGQDPEDLIGVGDDCHVPQAQSPE